MANKRAVRPIMSLGPQWDNPDLVYLSLGAGVQSTTLYLMACRDSKKIPGRKPDVAIFADTQQEPDWVYDNLERLKAWGDIPIEVCTEGDLGQQIEEGVAPGGHGFTQIPFWVLGQKGRGTPGRRYCTRAYKIDVIHQHVRGLLGLRKGKWAKDKRAVQWIGLSFDELGRMRGSKHPWVGTRWPLIEARMHREDCLAYLDQIGYPRPGKSSCIFCPYRMDNEYARWVTEAPEMFEKAVAWDERLRPPGVDLGPPQYISRSLKPLRQAVAEVGQVDPAQATLFEFDGMGDECDGICGV